MFRRQFESVTRQTRMDPATFATELEILAVRGFGDMGKCARNCMVRDKFITAQRSCGLRRHIDSVPPDTPIRDIVPIVPDSPIRMGGGSPSVVPPVLGELGGGCSLPGAMVGLQRN